MYAGRTPSHHLDGYNGSDLAVYVRSGGKAEEETPVSLANGLEQLFAVVMHQKIQCLGRESASKVEESTSYQVLSHIHHVSKAA